MASQELRDGLTEPRKDKQYRKNQSESCNLIGRNWTNQVAISILIF